MVDKNVFAYYIEAEKSNNRGYISLVNGIEDIHKKSIDNHTSAIFRSFVYNKEYKEKRYKDYKFINLIPIVLFDKKYQLFKFENGQKKWAGFCKDEIIYYENEFDENVTIFNKNHFHTLLKYKNTFGLYFHELDS